MKPVTQEQVQEMIKDALDLRTTSNQFAIPTTSYHLHNGLDSPKLTMNNLGIIAGIIGLRGGSANVSDLRITSSSVVCLTPLDAIVNLEGRCTPGLMNIYDGSGVSTANVNYIIILNP